MGTESRQLFTVARYGKALFKAMQVEERKIGGGVLGQPKVIDVTSEVQRVFDAVTTYVCKTLGQ